MVSVAGEEAELHYGKRTCSLILVYFYLFTCVGRTLGKLPNLSELPTYKMGQDCFKDLNTYYVMIAQGMETIVY